MSTLGHGQSCIFLTAQVLADGEQLSEHELVLEEHAHGLVLRTHQNESWALTGRQADRPQAGEHPRLPETLLEE